MLYTKYSGTVPSSAERKIHDFTGHNGAAALSKTDRGEDMDNKVVCVVGPTACGKTKMGVALAQRFGGEVVSVDSMQILPTTGASLPQMRKVTRLERRRLRPSA